MEDIILPSKFMTLNGVTFKKTDLKRLERYSEGTMLYVVVAGRKDHIYIKTDNIEQSRKDIIAQIEQ